MQISLKEAKLLREYLASVESEELWMAALIAEIAAALKEVEKGEKLISKVEFTITEYPV